MGIESIGVGVIDWMVGSIGLNPFVFTYPFPSPFTFNSLLPCC